MIQLGSISFVDAKTKTAQFPHLQDWNNFCIQSNTEGLDGTHSSIDDTKIGKCTWRFNHCYSASLRDNKMKICFLIKTTTSKRKTAK